MRLFLFLFYVNQGVSNVKCVVKFPAGMRNLVYLIIYKQFFLLGQVQVNILLVTVLFVGSSVR